MIKILSIISLRILLGIEPCSCTSTNQPRTNQTTLNNVSQRDKGQLLIFNYVANKYFPKKLQATRSSLYEVTA